MLLDCLILSGDKFSVTVKDEQIEKFKEMFMMFDKVINHFDFLEQ